MTYPSDSDDQPLFTIISLCYNHAPFLHDYFQGLLNQTYHNIQLILYDDCSTDESWQIIKGYEQQLVNKFAEVILDQGQVNLGAMRAYVHASEPGRIRGEYFSILEADDYYCSPTRVEQIIKYFQTNPEVKFVYSGVVFYYEEEGRSKTVVLDKADAQGWLFERLIKGNFILTCTAAYDVSLYKQCIKRGEYADRGYLMGDYPIFLELSLHTEFGYIDQPLACYRIRAGSTSRAKDAKKQLEFERSGYQIHLDFLEKFIVMPIFATLGPVQQARIYAKCGTCYRLLDNLPLSRAWYLKAIRRSPKSLRTYALFGLTFLGKNVFNQIASWRAHPILQPHIEKDG